MISIFVISQMKQHGIILQQKSKEGGQSGIFLSDLIIFGKIIAQSVVKAQNT